MPTTRPRYTVTDTGETADLLDLAERAWPDVADRRQLLLRLTEIGGATLKAQLEELDERRARQRAGLARAPQLVDVDALLGDQAWR
ncbi:MAG: hypothetical protein JHC95_08265 [Solirubrobacteraceae bacterium]|nr:hypothetical protein [Solirubrobacteraceae bacterium]